MRRGERFFVEISQFFVNLIQNKFSYFSERKSRKKWLPITNTKFSSSDVSLWSRECNLLQWKKEKINSLILDTQIIILTHSNYDYVKFKREWRVVHKVQTSDTFWACLWYLKNLLVQNMFSSFISSKTKRLVPVKP
jgi:hypothetical protein